MNFEENIEAYINNDLSEAERQAFDTVLTTDATLRQSVAEQRLIINLLRQNRAAIIANETATDAAKRQRLKGIISDYIAELPDAPVETLEEKAENVIARHEATEGVKIVPLNPSPVKKTKVWWSLAASFALIVAAGV